MPDSIKQSVTFSSGPQAVYDALMQKSRTQNFQGHQPGLAPKLAERFRSTEGKYQASISILTPAN